ncbi:MAG TPA: SRPBCC family protein [Allosphingosinicella sp.]|nr:SRPBCC family protein [Allosphingosinicella sp.]
MRSLPSWRGEIGPLAFAALAPPLLLSQHLLVFLAYRASGSKLELDASFWLLPLRRLAFLPELPAWAAALAFAFSLAVAWGLALLSLRRASRSRMGFGLAAFAVVPALQIPAIALLAFVPGAWARPVEGQEDEAAVREDANADAAFDTVHILQGLLAGVAIVVAAVLVSALTFGAYGWGLFVLTPFLVGITTAYLANRRVALTAGESMTLVLSAGGLGTLALLMLALEGFLCIVLVAPLAAAAAAAGGAIGRAAAVAHNAADRPLMSLALLPAIFAVEAAVPPAVPIEVDKSMDISAPPALVWEALISGDPITAPPGLVGHAGLAFPIRGRLIGHGIGAERLGVFSTGIARERVTAWIPARTLAFKVLSQPPAMEEMSPWRRVHAPHVSGYFETSATRFDLAPLPGGGTRLTVRTAHILRLDPVLYWEPIARWAIHRNVSRVMQDARSKAESGSHKLRRPGQPQR